jgi:hypothetical protein
MQMQAKSSNTALQSAGVPEDMRAHAEVEFGSDAPSRRVSPAATSSTTSQQLFPPLAGF